MSTPLFTETLGTRGPPVLLLHSSGMSSRQWKHLAARLSTDYRVTLVDNLGHGRNPSWPAGTPLHWHQDVAALAPVLEALDEPAHLVGHSYGGLLALGLGRAHPTRVRSLTLAEPVAMGVLRGSGVDMAALAPAAIPFHGPALPEDAAAVERWLGWFVDYWNGPGAFAALAPRMKEGFLATAHACFGEVVSLLADTSPVEDWARLAVPTLLLRGQRSPVEAREVCATLARHLPRATLLEIAGAGHLAPVTHAELVTAAIAEHLAAS